MTDNLKVLAIIGLVLGIAIGVVFGTAYFNTTVLPSPPDLTLAELSQRVTDCGVAHIMACKTCQAARETPNLPPPACYVAARTQALVLGDWVCIGCKNSAIRNKDVNAGGLIWQYIGRPINGFQWGVIGQRWKPVRRGPAK